MSDGYGSRQEPLNGTRQERPTQVIGALIARRLPGHGDTQWAMVVVEALRDAIQNVDEETWRRAWQLWAPQRGDSPITVPGEMLAEMDGGLHRHEGLGHVGSDRWTGGDRKDEP